MLIIGRKQQESIMINDNIEIVISEISGDRVQLAIDAPPEVIIMRKELYETNQLNREAANQAPSSAMLQGFAKALSDEQKNDK